MSAVTANSFRRCRSAPTVRQRPPAPSALSAPDSGEGAAQAGDHQRRDEEADDVEGVDGLRAGGANERAADERADQQRRVGGGGDGAVRPGQVIRRDEVGHRRAGGGLEGRVGRGGQQREEDERDGPIGQEDQEPADGSRELRDDHDATPVEAIAEATGQRPDESDDAGRRDQRRGDPHGGVGLLVDREGERDLGGVRTAGRGEAGDRQSAYGGAGSGHSATTATTWWTVRRACSPIQKKQLDRPAGGQGAKDVRLAGRRGGHGVDAGHEVEGPGGVLQHIADGQVIGAERGRSQPGSARPGGRRGSGSDRGPVPGWRWRWWSCGHRAPRS